MQNSPETLRDVLQEIKDLVEQICIDDFDVVADPGLLSLAGRIYADLQQLAQALKNRQRDRRLDLSLLPNSSAPTEPQRQQSAPASSSSTTNVSPTITVCHAPLTGSNMTQNITISNVTVIIGEQSDRTTALAHPAEGAPGSAAGTQKQDAHPQGGKRSGTEYDEAHADMSSPHQPRKKHCGNCGMAGHDRRNCHKQ